MVAEKVRDALVCPVCFFGGGSDTEMVGGCFSGRDVEGV